jgi:hypothetical protein
MAVVAMLIAFNLLSWNDAQVTAFEASLVAVLPLIVGAVQVVVGEIARMRVTPLVDPQDSDGEPLTRSDNSPALRAR